MSDSQEAIRLFVGGLPPAVTAQQLTGRFTSFGSVSDVAIVPSKFSGGASVCRGFAYVSFTPKDGMALQRCLSLYNGCKWLGGILRVEKSREHYLSKLQQEWQTPHEQVLDAAGLVQPDSAGPVRIPTPASSFVKRKLMTVQANKVKRIFAPIKGKQLSALSWDPPHDPPAVLKRKAAEQAAVEFSRKRMALPGPPPVLPQEASHTQSDVVDQSHAPTEDAAVLEHSEQKPDPQQQNSNPQQQHGQGATTHHTTGAAQQTQDEAEDEVRKLQPASSSSSEAGVIDFMSDDEDNAGQSAGALVRPPANPEQNNADDMSRFGSDGDSADEAQHAQQAHHAKHAQQAKLVSEATSLPQRLNLTQTVDVTQHDTTAKLGPTAVDLSRYDSDDEPSDAVRQCDGAFRATAQPVIPAVAAQVAHDETDLARFDSDSDSTEDARSSALNPHGQQADVDILEAGMGSQDPAMQSGTSSKDPHAQASASQLVSQAAVPINPSHTAAASQPNHQPENAALAAMKQQPQMPHQAQDIQLATSCKAVDTLASDEADSSSDGSEDLKSDTLSDSLPAVQLKQAPAEPKQLGNASAAYECTQQDAAQQSHPSSTSPCDLSSGDDGISHPEQSDQPTRQYDSEEQQSSGLSSDLKPVGSGEQDPDQQQEQVVHGRLREGNTTDESDAVSQAGTSSQDIESHHDDILEGATKAPREFVTQAAARSPADQQEASIYPDLSILKFGASFWRQHEAVSQRDWQTQRQVLQADYRAKRRAATKHTHRKRKAARS